MSTYLLALIVSDYGSIDSMEDKVLVFVFLCSVNKKTYENMPNTVDELSPFMYIVPKFPMTDIRWINFICGSPSVGMHPWMRKYLERDWQVISDWYCVACCLPSSMFCPRPCSHTHLGIRIVSLLTFTQNYAWDDSNEKQQGTCLSKLEQIGAHYPASNWIGWGGEGGL